MTATGLGQMERNIARCRLVLSIAALIAVYVDPAEPLLSQWTNFASGMFVMDARLAFVMVSHLVYSVLVYVLLWSEWVPQARVASATMWIDVLFGTAIGMLTEGVTSPSFPFFAFAVVAAGLRSGLRLALRVTGASVILYECLILISTRGGAELYLMRPVYLAITGYLVGYLGQQRLDLQEEMRELEAAEQRHRIARDLHDNFAQALAGINLQLESYRRRLRAQGETLWLDELTELQSGVKREFDQLRSYTRSLAGLDVTSGGAGVETAPRLRFSAELAGSADLVDHVLQIAREAIANVRRHARARSATIAIRTERAQVHMSIEDDGIGFRNQSLPWSIASRVDECGGRMEIVPGQAAGAHLLITVPQD